MRATLIGIDFGTRRIKVNIDGRVVASDDGRDYFDNSLIFTTRGRRQTGHRHGAQLAINSQVVFRDLVRMVGMKNHEIITQFQDVQTNWAGMTSRVEERDGELFFEVPNFVMPDLGPSEIKIERVEGKTWLRFEELLGMSLEQIQILSSNFVRGPANDAIISVPPWWGPAERKLMYTTAKLGGLEPQGFITETTAIALSMPIPSGAAVMILSLGYSSKASILQEANGQIKVLNETWLKDAGDRIDECIRIRWGLTAEQAQKAKEMLSFKDNLHPEELGFVRVTPHLAGKFTRQKLEEICRYPIERALVPLRLLLRQPEGAKIDTVYLAGGHSRMPLFKQLIEIGLKLKVILVEDHQASQGLLWSSRAIQGLPCTMEVIFKDFLENVTTYPLFDKFIGSGSHKVLSYDLTQDFEVTVACSVPDPTGDSFFSTSFDVFGVQDVLYSLENINYKNPSVRVAFTQDWLGIPAVLRADIFFLQEAPGVGLIHEGVF